MAADGGAVQALRFGHMPAAVIGDLDSLPHSARAAMPEGALLKISEQDTTDFEKCLTSVEAPLILAMGFTGGRTDHELAVYHALGCHPDRHCVVAGQTDIIFSAPPQITLALEPGERVSLFPLADIAAQSEGLRWDLEGVPFGPLSRVGTSNQALGPVTLRFDRPGMLLILPKSALLQAIVSLRHAPRWQGG